MKSMQVAVALAISKHCISLPPQQLIRPLLDMIGSLDRVDPRRQHLLQGLINSTGNAAKFWVPSSQLLPSRPWSL